MKKLILGFVICFAALGSRSGRADIFDRINTCENQGGGSCVFNLLRELAANSGPTASFLNGGVYVSDSWNMTVVVSGTTVTIYDTVTTTQAGEYHCTGSTCVGSQYSFNVINPDQIYMSYGRTWSRKVN